MPKPIFYKGQIPEWVALDKGRQRELAPLISKQIIRRPAVFILPLLQVLFAVWLIGFAPHFQLKDVLFFPMIIGSAAIAFLPYHAHFKTELLAVLDKDPPKNP